MRPLIEKPSHVEYASVVIAPLAADYPIKVNIQALFGGTSSKLASQSSIRGRVRIIPTAAITVKYNTVNDVAIPIAANEIYIDDSTAITDLFISSTPGATVTILLKYI